MVLDMALNRLGDYIELNTLTNENGEFSGKDVMGMTITKEVIPTKANTSGADLSRYWVVKPEEFIYNPRTHGKKIGLGFNETNKPFIISWNNIAFHIKKEKLNELNPYYLFIYLNRNEWDRWATFNSWGSSTEVFSWETFCGMEMPIPTIEEQNKIVAIYKGLKHNLKVYQSKLDDLKIVYEGYIEKLRREMNSQAIGPYIREVNVKNENGKIKLFQGVTVDHVFAEPKRVANDSNNGNVVMPNQFAFNKVMKSNNTKLPIALRKGEPCVVSGSYQVFEICKEGLLPDYLMMWFDRAETQRYAGFISFGTTRDIFTLDNMKEIKIPIPEIRFQEDIVKIHNAYIKRKNIVERLKDKINNICPILIRGAVREAKNG